MSYAPNTNANIVDEVNVGVKENLEWVRKAIAASAAELTRIDELIAASNDNFEQRVLDVIRKAKKHRQI